MSSKPYTHDKLTDPTREAVASMLVENTGTHMLDSGGASGRAWQRNQAAVGDNNPVEFFENSPEAWWGYPVVHPHANFREDKDPSEFRAELWVVLSVYHYLVNQVDFMPDMQEAYDAFVKADDEQRGQYNERTHLEIMQDFPEHWARLKAAKEAEEERETRRNGGYSEDEIAEVKDEDYYEEPGHPFGGRGDGFMCGYSYNEENNLSQDIQYVAWRDDMENYALIQIHGGADARGGLTAPKAFDIYEGEVFDWRNAACGCDNSECKSHQDGGWQHGFWDGWHHEGNGIPDLTDIPAIEGTREDAIRLSMENAGEDDVRLIIIEGEGYANTNTVCCPVCGTGSLTPYPYNY